MKAEITTRAVKALKPGEHIADTIIEGFRARCLPSAAVTFGYQYRAADSKRRWLSLGVLGDVTVDQARRAAKLAAAEVTTANDKVRRADDRVRASVVNTMDPATLRDRATDKLDAMLDNFLHRYVRANGLRSAGEIERSLKVYVRPVLGGRSIYGIGRDEISTLLDKVEDNSGPVQADRVMGYLRKAFNWQMTRDSKFVSPIIKGMARSKPAERARKRVLDDQEIRDLWQALDDVRMAVPMWFGTMVRTLLLTGQRLGNVQALHADALDLDAGLWVIEAEARRKLRDGLIVPLSEPVRDMLRDLAKLRPAFLFADDYGGDAPKVARFAKPKLRLDRALAALRTREHRKPMKPWTFHDLRRTARTIMSDYTTEDVAERAIGHKIPGVRGVYDHAKYTKQKRDAFEALAKHVMAAVRPHDSGGKVVAFGRVAR